MSKSDLAAVFLANAFSHSFTCVLYLLIQWTRFSLGYGQYALSKDRELVRASSVRYTASVEDQFDWFLYNKTKLLLLTFQLKLVSFCTAQEGLISNHSRGFVFLKILHVKDCSASSVMEVETTNAHLKAEKGCPKPIFEITKAPSFICLSGEIVLITNGLLERGTWRFAWEKWPAFKSFRRERIL